MPRRDLLLENNYYYHIFNRGVEKRNIFQDDRDFIRFLKILSYYRYFGPKPSFSKLTEDKLKDIPKNELIVEIICYCLMPNHFHLLLKQTRDNGIKDFIRLVSNGYTRYFNTRHNRIGPLFQGAYKAVFIETDEQFIHVSRYIHLNPLVSLLVKDLRIYQWSSYPDHIGIRDGKLAEKDEILGFFKNPEEYEKFVLDQASYAIDLAHIKHQLLDVEDKTSGSNFGS